MVTPVRLMRRVDRPGPSGPERGQYALQMAIRRHDVPWLAIGDQLQPGEIPWFWSWRDRPRAAAAAADRRPFICGPNILFGDSRRPCRLPDERAICDAASCRLLITESEWYRRLIESHRGPRLGCPIVAIPYPLDDLPPLPPAAAEPDIPLLIYTKGGYDASLVIALEAPNASLVTYGRYGRAELLELAGRSAACLYLSDDDRGPLALAEILAMGCPAVGLRRGAPWIEPGVNGFFLRRFDARAIPAALNRCATLDRQAIARQTRLRFDPRAIVAGLTAALAVAAAAVQPPIDPADPA